MTLYKNDKEMLFRFLGMVDYSLPLDKVLWNVAYDLGDWAFVDYKIDQILTLVKLCWVVLHKD